MASMQCCKPAEQKHYTENCKSKTTEHHSFTDKLKGMTNNGFLHHNKAQNGAKPGYAPVSHGATKSGCNAVSHSQSSGAAKAGCCSPTSHGTKVEKKKMTVKKAGHSNPKRSEHKKKNKKDGSCSDGGSSSDSSSDSESDNEKC